MPWQRAPQLEKPHLQRDGYRVEIWVGPASPKIYALRCPRCGALPRRVFTPHLIAEMGPEKGYRLELVHDVAKHREQGRLANHGLHPSPDERPHRPAFGDDS